jgi:hypothetical protein
MPVTAGSSAKGGGGSVWTEVASIVVGQVVALAFASSIKKDQEKFEKEIAKLDAEAQAELLKKIQQVQTEVERQKIVFQYVDKAKIEALQKETKRQRIYPYLGLGVGILLYVLLMLKLKKK